MAYDITNKTSLENIGKKWLPEVTSFCPDTPFIIVGTKSDFREDGKADGPNWVPLNGPNSGMEKAAELGAAAWLECSAKDQSGRVDNDGSISEIQPPDGLKTVFDRAIEIVLTRRDAEKKPKKSGGCAVL